MVLAEKIVTAVQRGTVNATLNPLDKALAGCAQLQKLDALMPKGRAEMPRPHQACESETQASKPKVGGWAVSAQPS